MKSALAHKNLTEKARKERPRHVVIEVTNTCFFMCRMCSIWKNKNHQEIDIKKLSKFIEDTGRYNPKTTISFTGGETLSSPHIFDLISCANNNKCKTILNTNGWLLNNENICRLLDSGLSQIAISLDGSTPDIHDKIRGIPGSYKRIIKGIRNIKALAKSHKREISIGINCVIFNDNIEDIIPLAQLVEDNKDIDALHFQAITAPFAEKEISNHQLDWYKHKNYRQLWIKNRDKLRKAYAGLLQMKKHNCKISDTISQLKMQYSYFLNPDERPKNIQCLIYKDLFINQKGDVFHCHIRNECLGNINSDSFEELWNNSKAIESRHNIKKCKISCHQILNCGIPE